MNSSFCRKIEFTNDLRSILKYSKHMNFVDDLQFYIHSNLDDLNTKFLTRNLVLINEDARCS